ncbi:peptide chain release factor 2 [Thioalkalivibrio sp. ALMg11]|uniref:peptide chain release factor 2 n=1 Tax=Thioalkalivibrio sp. ALMg11 TaxID=1158165 RepID=UPI0012DF1490|nr:peptide chain release factor 2 [Thioalkalivibrio sp. ALMg11]
MELNALYSLIDDLKGRLEGLRGYLDYPAKEERLEEVQRELEQNPDIWNDPEQAQALNKERAQLEGVVDNIREIGTQLDESRDLLEMAEADDDQETVTSVEADVEALIARIEGLEFRRMFSGDMDEANAYLDIQAGSGGTEAQDWANILLRMYLRWAEHKGFKAEVTELSEGETAGIKSATVHIQGEYAFGWLRTETGVHRLVRKSPFDSGNRRHTSFASVFASPEIDENFEIEINPADLRVDTYRSSGAGGQHVNTTDSAVRITHVPTGVVAACQAGRSQHKNREMAMNQLRAKLYERELQERNAERQAVEDTKSDIGWGSQIRSYVLDQSRIKDLRTGVEVGNTQGVLDGDLDPFIEASLKSGL